MQRDVKFHFVTNEGIMGSLRRGMNIRNISSG